MDWSSLSSMGGSVLGFAGDILGTAMTNKASAKAQKEAYRQAITMYQNRYQWQRQDMEKAGINPIYGAGGAGTMTAPPPAQVRNVLEGASASARGMAQNVLQAKALAAQIKNLEKQGENVDADTGLKYAQQAAQESSALLSDSLRDSEFLKQIGYSIDNLRSGYASVPEKAVADLWRAPGGDFAKQALTVLKEITGSGLFNARGR